jgi:hypothetical protein
MRPSIRRRSLRDSLIVLVGGVGLVTAATLAVFDDGAREDTLLREEATGSIGLRDWAPVSPRARRAMLPLSDEQRGHIFDQVMRMPNAPVADAPAPEVADALPAGVLMQDLPAGVTNDIPQVQGHKFVKFDDRILVVNPASRLVVAMIPRYKLIPCLPHHNLLRREARGLHSAAAATDRCLLIPLAGVAPLGQAFRSRRSSPLDSGARRRPPKD